MRPKTDLKVRGLTKNDPHYKNDERIPDGTPITGYYRYNKDDKLHLIHDMEGRAHIVDPDTIKFHRKNVKK
jgi:hypothetical protein